MCNSQRPGFSSFSPIHQTKPIAHEACSGLVQSIFSSPARLRSRFLCAYGYCRRAAKLKMLCIMQSSIDSTRLRQKRPRLKLDPKKYAIVRTRALERDGWRCQECGSMESLEVHHFKPRSQLGGDVMHNLITLCVGCHGKCHGRRR